MPEGNVLVTVDGKGVATITLNRPEVHNAIDDEAIERLTRELRMRSVSYTLSGLRTGGATAGAAGTAMTAAPSSRASRWPSMRARVIVAAAISSRV